MPPISNLQIQMFVDMPMARTFHLMATSDILICGTSRLSYLAGLHSTGVVLQPCNPCVGAPLASPTWIIYQPIVETLEQGEIKGDLDQDEIKMTLQNRLTARGVDVNLQTGAVTGGGAPGRTTMIVVGTARWRAVAAFYAACMER